MVKSCMDRLMNFAKSRHEASGAEPSLLKLCRLWWTVFNVTVDGLAESARDGADAVLLVRGPSREVTRLLTRLKGHPETFARYSWSWCRNHQLGKWHRRSVLEGPTIRIDAPRLPVLLYIPAEDRQSEIYHLHCTTSPTWAVATFHRAVCAIITIPKVEIQIIGKNAIKRLKSFWRNISFKK